MADNQHAIEILRTGSLTDVLVAAQCGEFSGLPCLCDLEQTEAILTLGARFDQREQVIIQQAICGCRIPVQRTEPTTVQPAVLTPPVVTPPAQPPSVTQKTETEPQPEICPEGLPPAGTFAKQYML